MFKPKYGIEIVNKVLKCFVEDYLDWYSNGYDWSLRKVESKHEGWLILEVWPEEASSYFTETSFIEDPITNEQLTKDMFVLLTENGPAFKDGDDSEEIYSLYEVDLSEVIVALSQTGTRVYSPYGAKVWSIRVGDGESKREPLLDLFLTQEAA
tara:strand:+ start:544 stop:1002 length:459 start_codon:yes stop_codon:yes gene_type:complete